ncbi:MAG: methyl-accepting chemotaxis protein [Defluviitaleaceae bacterium]|nr:methyl-accepting chemotaxis protein [Defluviitaleaceae bacterium]
MKHLKIRAKLFIVLGVSVLAASFVSVFGIININRLSSHIAAIDSHNVEPLNKLVSMTHYFDTLRSHLRDAVITFDPVSTDMHLATVGRLYGQLVEVSDAYLAHMVASGTAYGEEFTTISAFVNELPGAADIVGRVAERASANDQAGALRLIEEECVPYNTRMSDYLTSLAVINQRQSLDMVTAARQSATRSLQTMALVTAASILALLALIWKVIQSITIPIKRLLEASGHLAAGNFNINFETGAKDEISDLARALSSVTDTLNGLINDMDAMYNKHENEGNTSYVMDTSRFKGAYKEMADGVNKMVVSYINICTDVLKTMENIANGDLTITLPQYKGEKAEMNETVNKVAAAVREIVAEIAMMAKAGADGNLGLRTDAFRFNGAWANIANELNNLMAAFNGATNETISALGELSKGNFSYRITASYTGEYEKIKQAANDTGSSIDSYIKEVSKTLGTLAAGNLTQNISREYTGDFTAIRSSINQIILTLHETMRNISSASHQVLQGSAQISQSSGLLAQGASQQSGSVQELTVTVEGINDQTRENAANAQQAASLANTSKENAEISKREMTALLEAMNGITNSSNEISKIIKTIEDIAFQTNLLALNASVEAARAGEHGRGFTVVAEEVRTLAGRSAEAAQNTNALIQESIRRVKDGTHRANSTAESMNQIVGNVIEVAGVINKIYDASELQAESIGYMKNGINQISQVVQKNAAISEESAASSQELSSQASVLREMIGFFKI